MATFTSNFPELLETRDKMIFFKQFTQIPVLYPTLFEVRRSTKAFEDRIRVAGLGRFQLKPEGSPVAFDDPVQGVRRRVAHQTYAEGFRATHEALEDDQWNILDKMPADLGDAARDYRERLAWDLRNDAFAGATYTGLDGLSLLNAAHTNLRPEATAVSNVLAPAVALSVTGLESIMTLKRTTDSEEGRFVSLGQAYVVVAPALEHALYVLLETEFRPGTADNDLSTVRSTRSGLQPLVSPYVTSATNWTVHDRPGRNSLVWNEREDVNFSRARDADTFDMKFYGTFRCSVMFSEWRGNWGSNF